MSQFPNQLDDDSTIPSINDNITEIGGDVINDLRDAVFNIEAALGINIAGSSPSLAQRLGIFINPDGSPNTSVLFALGLVTLPITNNQIAENAGIPESKLILEYPTQNLFNYVRDLAKDVNLTLGWQSVTGIKLEPHLIGVAFRHDLSQIDVAETSIEFLNNVFRLARNNTNAYTAISDLNNELLMHQWADGSPIGGIRNIITNDGGFYPSNYGHTAGGIFLNTSRFVIIPQTAQDLQSFADFIDSSGILTLGTRIQNLYANGISRNSRSSSLTVDGYGQAIVPVTPAIAYLRGDGNNSLPIDDISMGDDIVQFMPVAGVLSDNLFDEQFALVRPGDIIRVSYASDGYNVEVPYIISEKKYLQGGGNKIFIVRIAGKNIAYSPNASARIDRALFNNNKYGVLAVAGVNSQSSIAPSLIVGSSRGAQCAGIGFSPDQLDENHYLLHLQLYPTGNPLDSANVLPGIDITGNQGTTPGSYTLESIVEITNNAFRQAGYNYRFIAFAYNGEFGIMLADSYNNASFSIISAIVKSDGTYDQSATQLNYPKNVIDLFPLVGLIAPDPLGFGPFGANIASPPFSSSFASPEAALIPTILFTPLRRNNYYVNGAELERLSIDVDQTLDVFGDGYWLATIDGYSPIPSIPGHMQVTYNIPLDLSASGLKVGKTLVVQSFGSNLGLINYGRFIIQSVIFSCCPPITTQITVYDAVHGTGVSPSPVAPIGSQVAIYFNSDSVAFNNETATDFSIITSPLKRSMEVYIDSNSNTYTHERGRFSLNGNLIVNGTTLFNSSPSFEQMDLVSISPKLRGYQFGSVTKINLSLTNFDASTGIIIGNLASFDGTNLTHLGPITSGRVGEIIRFYDETNIDYLDIIFNLPNFVPTLNNQFLDIQLFPSLQLDQEIMVIASCQIRTDLNTVNQIKDLRQFGNTSEQDLTTSALNYINASDRLLHFNGVVRGMDLSPSISYGTSGLLSFTGGLVLVNGNLQAINEQIFTIPALQESFNSVLFPINYALCLNEVGELITIVLSDFDAIFGTPNDPNRIVTVTNLVSSTTYAVDACTFSYLLNDRKDLTVLYIVSATVSGVGTSAITTLTARDVRRFINDSDSNVSAVLTSDHSQGNFKTLASAITWLRFNSVFQNRLEIKGSFTETTDPGINFFLNIVGGGDSATINFNNTVAISNVIFSNLFLTFNSTVTAVNVQFRDCVITTTLPGSQFAGCNFSGSIISFNGGETLNTCVMTDSELTTTTPAPIVIGSGNVFDSVIFTYSVNPVGFGSYNTNNLVNASGALLYGNSLLGLTIENCTFNSFTADHFPFISIQLLNTFDILQDVIIVNNQFTAQNQSNDLRAIIAITSTITTFPGVDAYPKYPKLINVYIDDNICNYDQMIVISTDRIVGQPITGSMLGTVNCRIQGNTCGTIGFITANTEISSFDNANSFNNGFIRNKFGQLLINNNSCKLITNLDSTGSYIPFNTVNFPVPSFVNNWVQTGTGPCTISNNSVNWIQVGSSCVNIAFDPDFTNVSSADVLSIIGNRLIPNDPIYLLPYADTNTSGVTLANVGILVRAENNNALGPQNIISQNTITQDFVTSLVSANDTFYYQAAIAIFNSVQMSDNIIFGVVNSPFNSIIYLGVGMGSSRISNNIINRNNLTVLSYIFADAVANGVSIINNTFDSPFVDAGNTIDTVGLNFPNYWEYRNNVNQTFYIEVPLIEDAVMTANSGGGTNGNPSAFPTNAPYIIQKIDGNLFEISRLSSSNGSYLAPTSQYLQLTDTQVTAPFVPLVYGRTFGIDYLIPPNSKILTVNMGAYMVVSPQPSPPVTMLNFGPLTSDPTSTNNCITLSVLKFAPINTSNSANGVLDIQANIQLSGSGNSDKSNTQILFTNFPINNFSQEATIRNETVYTPIDLTAQNFMTGQNYRIAISVDASFLRFDAVDNGAIILYLSPVVVKCLYGG